jgi:disulfide bond formation protein DsbB
MSPFVASITRLFSILTLLGDVGIVLLIAGAFLFRRQIERLPVVGELLDFVTRNSFTLAFILATLSTAGSLFYSTVADFPACSLCWIQRIFMFPQVVLLGVALFKRDWKIADYSIAFSIVGGVTALYHQFLQFGGSPFIPCSASATAVSCSQRYFLEFGYITIPMMSLTIFGLLILLMVLAKRAAQASA